MTASGGRLSRDLSELIETYLSHTQKGREMKRKARSNTGATVASVRITASTAPDDSSHSKNKIVIQSGYALSGSSENDRGELCRVSVSEPRLKALLSSNAAALRELSKQTRALARFSRRTKSPLPSEGRSHLLEQHVKAVNLSFARYIKSREALLLYIKTSLWQSKFYGESTGTVRSQTIRNQATILKQTMNPAAPYMVAPIAVSPAKQLASSSAGGRDARPDALMGNAS